MARVLTSLESQPKPAAHSTKAGTWIRGKRNLGSDTKPQASQQMVYSTNTGRMPRDGTHSASGVLGPGSPDRPHCTFHQTWWVFRKYCMELGRLLSLVYTQGPPWWEKRNSDICNSSIFPKRIKLSKEICSSTWDGAETRRRSLSSMSQRRGV